MEGEIKLRNVQLIVLFMAIAKQGRSGTHTKKLQPNEGVSSPEKKFGHHRKQFSGIVSSLSKNEGGLDWDMQAMS